MKKQSLLLTLGLALATTYGLAQTGQAGSQAGQYPSSQSPTTQQPSTQAPTTAPEQGQTTAPDQTQSTASSATAPDNDALAQQVQQKLSTEPALKGVQVEAKKGVVTLSGSVASKADRKHAEELAKSVPGVKKVHAKLKVNPNAATTSGAAEMPAPSAAGSEAGNTSAQAGVQQGNQEPGSMSGSAQAESQQQGSSAEAGANSQVQQSPGTTQTEPAQTQPGMSQEGVQTPNNQMGTAQSATQIQSEIQNALQQQGTLSGTTIQTNVTDTDVELTGTVTTPEQKQTAERIAGSYAGSRRVVNHITVSSLSGQMGTSGAPATTQPQSMPGQGSVNPQTPPRQTPPPQQNPPMSENPPQPQL